MLSVNDDPIGGHDHDAREAREGRQAGERGASGHSGGTSLGHGQHEPEGRHAPAAGGGQLGRRGRDGARPEPEAEGRLTIQGASEGSAFAGKSAGVRSSFSASLREALGVRCRTAGNCGPRLSRALNTVNGPWRAWLPLLVVPWFLWSTVYPGGTYRESDITARPVREFPSQAACEKALPVYRVEVDRAFPQPIPKKVPAYSEGLATSAYVVWHTLPSVKLQCSPVNPR